MDKKIYIIRHAESEQNIGIFHEHSGTNPLTSHGHKQASELSKTLVQPSKIIVSKFIRTIQTAEPVIKKFPDTEIHVWSNTHEYINVNTAKLIDKTNSNYEVREKFVWSINDPFYRDGDMNESFAEFVDRVLDLILELQKLTGINYVFTHAYVIRMLKVLLNKHSGTYKLEHNALGSKKFYLQIKKEFGEIYESGDESRVPNVGIVDFTQKIENFILH